MDFPLQLTFKVLALGNRLSVTDARGSLLFFVRQKKFKLREAVAVFADEAQTRQLYSIQADRILDFSARYTIADAAGMPVGAVSRQGAKSLFKAHYDVWRGDHVVMTITEENPWVKFLDGLLQELPVVGMVSGYLLHPSYAVARADGTPVLRFKKEPAFFESRFTVQKLAELDREDELRVVLALVMVVLLERERV